MQNNHPEMFEAAAAAAVQAGIVPDDSATPTNNPATGDNTEVKKEQ